MNTLRDLNQKIITTFLTLEENTDYIITKELEILLNDYRKQSGFKESLDRKHNAFIRKGNCLFHKFMGKTKPTPVFDITKDKYLTIDFAHGTMSIGLLFALTDNQLEKL